MPNIPLPASSLFRARQPKFKQGNVWHGNGKHFRDLSRKLGNCQRPPRLGVYLVSCFQLHGFRSASLQCYLPTSLQSEKIFSTRFKTGFSFLCPTFLCQSPCETGRATGSGRGIFGRGMGCGFAALSLCVYRACPNRIIPARNSRTRWPVLQKKPVRKHFHTGFELNRHSVSDQNL